MSTTLMGHRAAWPGTAAKGSTPAKPQRQRSICVTGLTKAQAEDLLDWLEAHACRNYHLSYVIGKGFTISYSWVDRAD